jgi:hypothetical protein
MLPTEACRDDAARVLLVPVQNLGIVNLTPLLTPTDPNRSRLRATRLDEDPSEIPVRRAFSDMNRRPDTISLLRAESGLRDGPDHW